MSAPFVFDGVPMAGSSSGFLEPSAVKFTMGVSGLHSRKKSVYGKSNMKTSGTSPTKKPENAASGSSPDRDMPSFAVPPVVVQPSISVGPPTDPTPLASPLPQPSVRQQEPDAIPFEIPEDVKFAPGSRLSRRRSMRKPSFASTPVAPPVFPPVSVDDIANRISGLFVGMDTQSTSKENSVPVQTTTPVDASTQPSTPAVSEPVLDPSKVQFSMGKKNTSTTAGVHAKLFPFSKPTVEAAPAPAFVFPMPPTNVSPPPTATPVVSVPVVAPQPPPQPVKSHVSVTESGDQGAAAEPTFSMGTGVSHSRARHNKKPGLPVSPRGIRPPGVSSCDSTIPKPGPVPSIPPPFLFNGVPVTPSAAGTTSSDGKTSVPTVSSSTTKPSVFPTFVPPPPIPPAIVKPPQPQSDSAFFKPFSTPVTLASEVPQFGQSTPTAPGAASSPWVPPTGSSSFPFAPPPAPTSFTDARINFTTMFPFAGVPEPAPSPALAAAATSNPVALAEAARVKGNGFFNAGKYEDAVVHYSEAIREVPSDHLALANRAAAYLMLNEYMAAALDAEEAVRLQPGLVKAISRACRAYMALGHRAKAKDIGQKLPASCSDSDASEIRDILSKIRVYEVKLADCKMRMTGNSFRDANRIAEEACAMYPVDLDGHIMKLKALLGMSKYGEAITLARSKLTSDLSGTSNDVATRHAQPKQVEEVFVCLLHAVWCLDGTEKALQVLGLYQGAREVAKVREMKAMITKVERFKAAGNEHFNNKSYDEAVEQYAHGLEALKPFPNPKLRVVLLANRVASFMAMGRYQDAITDATVALRLDSHHIKVRLRRARCHVALGNFDQGVRDFEQGIADMRAAGAPDSEIADAVKECQDAKAKKAEKAAAKARQAQQESQRARKPSPPPFRSAAPPPPPQQPPPQSSKPAYEVDAEFPNHYAILGVTEFTATSVEIKRAYHKLALKYHPDKVGVRAEGSPLDVTKAEAVFKRVSAAYAVLNDATDRSKFDRELREHKAKSSFRAATGGGVGGFTGSYDPAFMRAYFSRSGRRR